MSMSLRLTEAFARIGSEFKSVRSAIDRTYTIPPNGIPLEDLSTGVTTAFTPTWANIAGKPTSFQPSPHDHQIDHVIGLQDALNTKVSSATGTTINVWVGTVADLPTTKNANTVYLAW